MYWQYNNTPSPQIEAMLQKPGVTLEELMDQNDIIQECKMQNKKLVEFLCQREILEDLVTLITEEPSESLDERNRFKYPNIACELLTCDVPALNETLSRDNVLLEKLYSFIDREPPLNPLLASFLSKTLGVLIVKRRDQAMGFLKDKENFVSLLLRHLGTSAIMDLTLKLITEVGEDEHRQNLLNWLDSQRLIQSIIDLFDPQVDSERHHNASQLLCDVLKISTDPQNRHWEQDTDPILTRLESPETVSQLLDHMLGVQKTESSVVGGIQVLLTLLGWQNNYRDPSEVQKINHRQKIMQSTASVIVKRLKDFHEILLDPPKKMAVKTSIGTLDPPLGNTRLQVTRLLAALIASNHSDILQEIINLGMIEVLLDLFFKYAWNNFLHAQVELCIAGALNAHVKYVESIDENDDNNAMYPYLVLKCRLLGRILEAWDENEEKQTKPSGLRQGYMGHLINIANLVVKQCVENSLFDAFIKENMSKDSLETWVDFVNGPLAEMNRSQNIILGGVHPNTLNNDDNNDDCSVPFTTSGTLNQEQMLNDFHAQQNTLENYYFRDDEFNEMDEAIHPLERRANINLNTDIDMESQEDLFNKICSECMEDPEDNIFEDNTTNCNSNTIDNNWNPRISEHIETIKSSNPWEVETNRVTDIPDQHNPWSNVDSSHVASADDSWANFDSFQTDFNLATSVEQLNIANERGLDEQFDSKPVESQSDEKSESFDEEKPVEKEPIVDSFKTEAELENKVDVCSVVAQEKSDNVIDKLEDTVEDVESDECTSEPSETACETSVDHSDCSSVPVTEEESV